MMVTNSLYEAMPALLHEAATPAAAATACIQGNVDRL